MKLLNEYGRKWFNFDVESLLVLDKVRMECTNHKDCVGCAYEGDVGCYLFVKYYVPDKYRVCLPCKWKTRVRYELDYTPDISEVFDTLGDMSIPEKLELGIYERIENVTTG